MKGLTSIAGHLFSRRVEQIDRYDSRTEEIQTGVLNRLVRRAAGTEWGRAHNYRNVRSYDDFVREVPVTDYNDIFPMIERMAKGEKDVLWRGRVRKFAMTSGTSGGDVKMIPVSEDSLADTHYRGGADSVALYLHNRPDSRFFDGKSLILGDCYRPKQIYPESIIGAISAILIDNVNPLVKFFRVPEREIALLEDFEKKIELIIKTLKDSDVTSLSGIPSWMLMVLKRMLDETGTNDVSELWPNLEVFFHGGVSFAPYREQFRTIIPNDRMRYVETYNASEGFFGIQNDLSDRAMLLMMDYGVFYEFILTDEYWNDTYSVVPVWGVEVGREYAMLISTSSGLWRFPIGDTVRFMQKDPYKFVITGRTRCMINMFGEKLSADEAQRALDFVCQETGVQVSEYTVAPFAAVQEWNARHQWVIEFAHKPDNLSKFGEMLDAKICEYNYQYRHFRENDFKLKPLEIIEARPGLFYDWMKSEGKFGGQHKVPRLCADCSIIDKLLAFDK